MGPLYTFARSELVVSTICLAILISVCLFAVDTFIRWMDLPEVHRNSNNQCVKVINYRNGDAYGCQDVDVILRKYRLIHVQ